MYSIHTRGVILGASHSHDHVQVHLLGDVANGSEATDLELLWTRRSDNKTVSIHTVKGEHTLMQNDAKVYRCI